jgi:hypothetical protein
MVEYVVPRWEKMSKIRYDIDHVSQSIAHACMLYACMHILYHEERTNRSDFTIICQPWVNAVHYDSYSLSSMTFNLFMGNSRGCRDQGGTIPSSSFQLTVMQAANSGDKTKIVLDFRAPSRNQIQIDSDVGAAGQVRRLCEPNHWIMMHEARPEFCHPKIISINLREV